MAKILVGIGKLISSVSRVFRLGHGSTWPGHVALSLNPKFIQQALNSSRTKVIFIAGTNGKTTTGKLVRKILEKAGYSVFQNESGANLLNGIASAIILNSRNGNLTSDFAIFEIDENTLPLALPEIAPDYLVLLNLFRDQLDRYGEVNTIARKWRDAIAHLSSKTTLILNADDPQVAILGSHHSRILYFGLNNKTLAVKTPQHAVDSTYCPNCNQKLSYKTIYFSHLGDWKCANCSLQRPGLTGMSPFYPLAGVYNRYNTLAAVLVAKANNINNETIQQSLKSFSPAFGRQEIIEVDGKRVQLFLSKNPTSFNESLRTVLKLKAKNILLVLNDRIPDGRDVSWIWDIDTEELIKNEMSIIISGDRAYDMGLRLKYSSSSEFSISNFQFSMKNSNFKFQIEADLKKAMTLGIKQTPKSETFYILPTYSAMLEVRKILTGKKIL